MNEIRCYMSVLKWGLMDNKCSVCVCVCVCVFLSPIAPLVFLKNPVLLVPFFTRSWRAPSPLPTHPNNFGKRDFWRRPWNMPLLSCHLFLSSWTLFGDVHLQRCLTPRLQGPLGMVVSPDKAVPTPASARGAAGGQPSSTR